MTNGIVNGLKPCPFCGGKAVVLQLPVGIKSQGMYTVGCIEDSMCFGHISHVSMTFVSRKTAADTWNTRASL
jgi:hypothetical protein